MTVSKNKLISIWFWVGLVLGIYGFIVFGTGVYYLFEPNPAAQLGHNPGLWWGGVMLVAGLVFLAIGRFGKTDNPE